MNGKIVKIVNNDLYGNVDSRKAVIFACFNHIKYMNKYVIFTFEGEYDKNKLYFGSIHIKDNTLVVFSIKDDLITYITDFTTKYLSKMVDNNEYQILDITNIDRVELVSSNSIDCDKLQELDNLSIFRVNNQENSINKEKKPILLYFILIILIILVVGLTYLYLKPDAFETEYKRLTCEKELYNYEVSLSYKSTKVITFDKDNHLKNIMVTDNYIFSSIDKYLDFKDNDKQNEYFNTIGTYKYDDDKLELIITYKEKTIIDNYQEMFSYLKDEEYKCTEETYYE